MTIKVLDIDDIDKSRFYTKNLGGFVHIMPFQIIVVYDSRKKKTKKWGREICLK